MKKSKKQLEEEAAQLARQQAEAEAIRLERERKERENDLDRIEAIEIENYGVADIRGQLALAFGDLFSADKAQPEAEPEPTPEPEPQVPEKPPEKLTSKGRKKKEREEKEAREREKAEELAAAALASETGDDQSGSLTPAADPEPDPVELEILEIQAQTEAKLQLAKTRELEILQSFADAKALDEEKEKAVFAEYQLIAEVDIPVHELHINAADHPVDIKSVMKSKQEKIASKIAPRKIENPERLKNAPKLKERITLLERQKRAANHQFTREEKQQRAKKVNDIKEKRKQHLLKQITSDTEMKRNVSNLNNLQRKSNFIRNERHTGIPNAFHVEERGQAVDTELHDKTQRANFKREIQVKTDERAPPPNAREIQALEMERQEAAKLTPEKPKPKLKLLFDAIPRAVEFRDYISGGEYFLNLKVRNLDTCARRMQVLPPSTPFFSSEAPV